MWCIWTSSFIQTFLKDPQLRLLQFMQGPLGRPFAKPTRLLHGRLPELPAELFSAYAPGWYPSRVLIGRHNGQWATTAAKEYPPRLCRVIASQLTQHAQRHSFVDQEEDPPHFAAMVEALGRTWDIYLHDDHGVMLNDYQPELMSFDG